MEPAAEESLNQARVDTSELFSKIAALLESELQAGSDDFTLIEQMNLLTSAKYREMVSALVPGRFFAKPRRRRRRRGVTSLAPAGTVHERAGGHHGQAAREEGAAAAVAGRDRSGAADPRTHPHAPRHPSRKFFLFPT